MTHGARRGQRQTKVSFQYLASVRPDFKENNKRLYHKPAVGTLPFAATR